MPTSQLGAGELLVRVGTVSMEGGDLLARRRLSSGPDKVIGCSAEESASSGTSSWMEDQDLRLERLSSRVPGSPRRDVLGGAGRLDLRVAASVPVSAATAALALRPGRPGGGRDRGHAKRGGGVGTARPDAARIGAASPARVRPAACWTSRASSA